MKLEVHDTYKTIKKLTTNFEPIDDLYVKNKTYLDEKVLKLNGHLTSLEKNYNEVKLQYNKVYRRGLSSKSPKIDDTNTL